MSFSDLKIKRIETSADTLTVELMDGRVLTVPLALEIALAVTELPLPTSTKSSNPS